MRYQAVVWILAAGVVPCAAQPFPPFVFDVQNSASYSRSIAQGAIFVAFGGNLGPAALVQATSSPLTTLLAGTSVTVRVAGTVIQCPMVYTSARQIAAIMPSNTPVGSGTLTVTFNGQTSPPTSITVSGSNIGIYTVSSSGIGPGIVTGADFITKTIARPAKTGETLIAWTTGLGALIGGDTEPRPGIQFSDVQAFVGDRAAKVVYAGRSGCCPGLDQIAFELPDGPQSCFVPFSIRTPGGSSNFVTFPASANGEPCTNPATAVPPSLLTRAVNREQLKLGILAVGPTPVLQGAGFSFSQALADQLSKTLQMRVPEADVARLIRAYRNKNMALVGRMMGKYSLNLKALDAKTRAMIRAAIDRDQQGASALLVLSSGLATIAPQVAAYFPAVGTCTVVQRFPDESAFRTTVLDAGGTLTIDSPFGRRTLQKTSKGQYQALLGAAGNQANTARGLYAITAAGGRDIGTFTASLNVTSSVAWTNKSTVAEVDRTQPLTLTWSGGSSDYVLIGGTAEGWEGPEIFACVEETRKGTFTVPQFILAALPATRNGTMFITPHPLANPISIPGLDLAFIADASSDSREVVFR